MSRRIHLKRKPPLIKRKVFDGKSCRTKYVRMPPILDESDVVKQEEHPTVLPFVTEQNLEFPSQEQQGACSSNNMAYAEKRKRVIDSWERIRENLLVTRVEELSPATNICALCNSEELEIIYCQDCGPNAYYCSICFSRIHKNILFHKPQQWKNCMYIPLPVTNELTRKDHECASSYSSVLYAVDVKGTQHTCRVVLCRCEDPAITLLRYNLWPATPTSPKIAFDLRFMELLSVLQLECHLPAKTFCEALGCMHSNFVNIFTDVGRNIYRAVVGDCLTEYNFHRSSLNTRHNITESAFGKECPICLKTPPIVSLDANFGLVHKISSGDGHGRKSARHKAQFFLDHQNLKRFIDDYAADKKMSYSECSNFQAGNAIRSKVKNKKLDVTGIFGSVCKHDFPLFFIDLAHGERLSYPVFLIQCLLENREDNLLVMYDIACMLHKHLKKTQNNSILEKCSFAVPVFHSFAHNTSCQLTYGQRYAKATGMTDGEGIERLWSYLRGFRRITKEMSINNRQDLLSEAMLHQTDKLIWNLDHRMAEKRKRCRQILVETEDTIKTLLSELNETEDRIDTWFTDWKALCAREDIKASTLTADEQYAECLQKVDLEKGQLQRADTDDEKKDIEMKIERLSHECKKLKRKAILKDIAVASDQGQRLLNSVKRKKQSLSLLKLKELSTDRQYLSSLMKKYADGQAIGVRISKQFTVNFNKIKAEVEIYNLVSDQHEDVKSFLSPCSSVYDQLTSSKLSSKQQQAVQANVLREHAQEELINIENEIKQYFSHLSFQSSHILQVINDISCLEKSRVNLGKLHYLNQKHLNIEKLYNSCSQLFADTFVDNTTIPNKVHDFLNKSVTSSLQSFEMPTAEEMQTILAEISEIENSDEQTENMADDDEDEDDDDDNDDE